MYHNKEFFSVKERCTCDILFSNFGCLLIRWIYNDLLLVSLCLNIMYHQDYLWHGIKYLYFWVSRTKCHDLSLITKVSSIRVPSLWITLPWEPLIAIITVALKSAYSKNLQIIFWPGLAWPEVLCHQASCYVISHNRARPGQKLVHAVSFRLQEKFIKSGQFMAMYTNEGMQIIWT